MSDVAEVQGITKRQLVLFFVVDTSGSMAGTKIGTVNTAIREIIPTLAGVAGSDADLKIACLQFSSGCEWLNARPVSADVFTWRHLEAEGVTDLGIACHELADKLSRKSFLKAPSASFAPVIILLSDGEPTDDYKSGLTTLQNNKWFQAGTKAAIAIGDNANKAILAEFTGTMESVLEAHTPDVLEKWIKKVSVASIQIGSRSQYIDGSEPDEKQQKLNEQLQQIQQQDADLQTSSTQKDDWD